MDADEGARDADEVKESCAHSTDKDSVRKQLSTLLGFPIEHDLSPIYSHHMAEHLAALQAWVKKGRPQTVPVPSGLDKVFQALIYTAGCDMASDAEDYGETEHLRRFYARFTAAFPKWAADQRAGPLIHPSQRLPPLSINDRLVSAVEDNDAERVATLLCHPDTDTTDLGLEPAIRTLGSTCHEEVLEVFLRHELIRLGSGADMQLVQDCAKKGHLGCLKRVLKLPGMDKRLGQNNRWKELLTEWHSVATMHCVVQFLDSDECCIDKPGAVARRVLDAATRRPTNSMESVLFLTEQLNRISSSVWTRHQGRWIDQAFLHSSSPCVVALLRHLMDHVTEDKPLVNFSAVPVPLSDVARMLYDPRDPRRDAWERAQRLAPEAKAVHMEYLKRLN